jgi:hypothetical protein
MLKIFLNYQDKARLNIKAKNFKDKYQKYRGVEKITESQIEE